ncbi:MAG: DNA polymerase I [Nitrospirae bacterium]|nr:MAG: DNA polymerase I [Nitrospirota bacterium]
MTPRPVLYLIDGSAYLYRAFFALPDLSTAAGLPTNAVYGFITMLQKIIRERRPDCLAVVFDEKGPTLRHEEFKEYKAHRPPMPDALSQQIPYIHRVVDAFAIPVVKYQGFEADDLIGTLARQAASDGLDVVIVTGDKDMFQLLSPAVRIFDPVKDRVFTEEDCRDRFGVEPARVVEVMGLMGDQADNIPGVKGIGEKTAKKLIAEFGTIEQLLARLGEVKGEKLRALLDTQADQARQSRRLATIVTDCPVSFERGRFRLGEARTEELRALYRELEFWGLLKSFSNGPGDGKGPEDPVLVPADPSSRARAVEAIKQAGQAAICCEVAGHDPLRAEFLGAGVCPGPGAPAYFFGESGLDDLRAALESPSLHVDAHDYKAAWVALRRARIAVPSPRFDTMVAGYLLNPNRRSPTLAMLAQEHLGESLGSASPAKKPKKGDLFDQPDDEAMAMRAGHAASAIARLRPVLAEKLAAGGLTELFDRVELPLTVVLGEMEAHGFRLDTAALARLAKELAQQLDGLLEGIYRKAGTEFNVNSPKQLSEVLFEKLQLPPTKKTKTGYSTDEEVLTQLALQHELPADILNYRSLSKLKSTYVDALPLLVHPETGRLHTSLNQTVTATGRLSSSEPNLQNIPVKGEWGGRIREAFVADAGCLLLSADYNQIEPRILAHLAQDPVLIGAFARGDDIHRATAVEIFGLPAAQITKDMRRVAKTVNFGIIYGISPYGLSSQLGISQQESKKHIDAYFARFQGVKAFLDKTIADAKENGYVTTMLGRRRPIPELRSGDPAQRSMGERMAMNTPIQGTAADVIKLAMLAVHRRLAGTEARMILQVHDELIFEVAEAEVEGVRRIVVEEMERVVSLAVPLKVDVGIGTNWRVAHP